jgi:hypothetical protein
MKHVEMYDFGGLQKLATTGASETIQIVAFAVEFGTDQLEHLLAAVMAVKGA